MQDKMTASRTLSLPMKTWAVIAERAEIHRISMSKALVQIIQQWDHDKQSDQEENQHEK